jgi:hypothetical protein
MSGRLPIGPFIELPQERNLSFQGDAKTGVDERRLQTEGSGDEPIPKHDITLDFRNGGIDVPAIC